jgi:hypothetical protein
MTYSTAARLYQLRSKMTISSAEGKMLHAVLHEHLRLLAIRRRGERHDAEHARADFLGDRLDRAALAGGIPAFEQDDDPKFLFLHLFLQMAYLNLKLPQLLLVILPLQLRRNRMVVRHGMARFLLEIGRITRPRRSQC